MGTIKLFTTSAIKIFAPWAICDRMNVIASCIPSTYLVIHCCIRILDFHKYISKDSRLQRLESIF
jgi:hypothetical protein